VSLGIRASGNIPHKEAAASMGSTAASLEDSYLEDIEKAKYQLISASSKILSKPFVSSLKKAILRFIGICV